jgi:serine/threonine protein kinase/tetratricopeptide (TPR) repeat protein
LEELPPDPLLGKVFGGKYEIESVLGKGGMSVVYKARDVFMERIVAIKLLHSHLVADNSAILRFQQEAQAAGNLNHPNIITVYDFGLTQEDQAYLIMECFEGPTLAQILDDEQRVSPERGLRIMKQICDGLDHAHRKGVVHRDLKPSNLCLHKAEDGTDLVKIVDFGIAKLLPQDGKQRQQLTQTGQIFGSPLFMSPEQCQGKPLDARSDLYSLGCLMYEALTGVPPFMGDTAFDTMTMHINEPPKPLKRAAPDVQLPPEIENPIMRLLEKDANKRYPTAAAVKADLPPLPEELQSGTQSFAPSWYNSIKHNHAARNTIIITLAIFIPFCLIFFFWNGTSDEQGTGFQRAQFIACTWLAERMMNDIKDYQHAKLLLGRAEWIATDCFHDTAKERSVFEDQAQLGWLSGDSEYALAANKKLLQVLDQRTMQSYQKEMKLLDDLAKTNVSQVEKEHIVMARKGRVKAVAQELDARQWRAQEEILLKRALVVDSECLKESRDRRRIAELDALLAECYRHMQKTPSVLQLLQESYDIFQQYSQSHPDDSEARIQSVEALLKVGQFERDQNMMPEARRDLTLALERARKLGPSDTLVEALNSYADYCSQMQFTEPRNAAALIAESKRIFAEADQVNEEQSKKSLKQPGTSFH